MSVKDYDEYHKNDTHAFFRFSDIYKVDLVNDSLYEWNVRLMK